jgi:hypothetical protein
MILPDMTNAISVKPKLEDLLAGNEKKFVTDFPEQDKYKSHSVVSIFEIPFHVPQDKHNAFVSIIYNS